MMATLNAITNANSDSDFEAERMLANRAELVERIMRAVRADAAVEPIPSLRLNRLSSPKAPLHTVYDPVLCVIAQGSKEVFLDDERYVCDPNH